ncbi:MAG: hypothetical protein ACPG6V_11415 [Flavobacteriales bacterium]
MNYTIPVIVLVVFAIYYLVVIPKLKGMGKSKYEDFEKANQQNKTIFKEEILKDYFGFIQELETETIQSKVQCENLRSLGEKSSELLKSAGRSVLKRSMGGSSRDVNKTYYQSYLFFTDTTLVYREFSEDDFSLTKEMRFDLNAISDVYTKDKTAHKELGFTYNNETVQFDLHPYSFPSLSGGFGKKSIEIANKTRLGLVDPFMEKIKSL